MNADLQQTMIFSAICVWVIQALKASPLCPWITHETQTANKLLSAVLASLHSAGILFAAQNLGGGNFNLTIKGLTLAHAAKFLFHAVGNYAMQKGWFKLYTMNGNANGAKIQELIEKIKASAGAMAQAEAGKTTGT